MKLRPALGLFALPLTLFYSSFLAAQGTVADWEWGYADDGSYLWAATLSDESMMLGEFCFFDSESCVYFFAQDVECVVDDSYPVLLNSSYALAAEISCSHPYEGLWVYVFNDYDLVDPYLRDGKQFGIAMALDDDNFQIARFSLKGSQAVLDEMETVFVDLLAGYRPVQQGLKQQVKLPRSY